MGIAPEIGESTKGHLACYQRGVRQTEPLKGAKQASQDFSLVAEKWLPISSYLHLDFPRYLRPWSRKRVCCGAKNVWEPGPIKPFESAPILCPLLVDYDNKSWNWRKLVCANPLVKRSVSGKI